MKICWICNRSYGSLSKEHIIPRMFEGITTTEEFSCEECNREIGKAEQHLAPLGILMANLDNADGEPKITTPKRGSRTKDAVHGRKKGKCPTVMTHRSNSPPLDGYGQRRLSVHQARLQPKTRCGSQDGNRWRWQSKTCI